MERLTHVGTELSDEKQSALQELHDFMARTVAIIEGFEAMEHRVAAVIEGGRQQLSHVVADLHLPEMRQELRAMVTTLKNIEKKL
jgi:hypothetical protein